MIKRIILKQILNYGYQTKRNKKYKKNKTNINKISEINKIPKSINNLSNDSKKLNKAYESVLSNKKKFISINISGDTIKKKDKNKNTCCQTTKHNNKINFEINSMNNKKSIPISPKVTLKTERYSSPLNNLNQSINNKKSSLSKILKKNNSKLFKNENSTKNNKKKQCQLKTKEIINKMSSTKSYQKNNEKSIISHKNNSNLDSIRSNNSKFDIKSNYEESNSTFILYSNSKYNNNFHHDILNLNKNDITLIAYNHNYNNIEKNKYKRQKIDKKYNLLTNNNKSELHNTETVCNPIDTFLKYKGSQWNSKIYENNLYKDKKYKIFYSQEKDEFPNRTSNNYNNNNGNKNRKKKNNIPKSKYTILNKKEKERKIFDKKYGSYKNYIKNSTYIINNHNTINETNSNYSKLTSIESISIKTNKKDIKNILLSIYFSFWKEYIDKKNILQQLTKISKFINHINNFQKKILIKYSMQKLKKIIQKKDFYQYIMKMIYKMITNIMIKINGYKKRNMREIKIFKKNIYNNIHSHFHKEKGDIINNININNYIHYNDYKLLIKRKNKNPYLLSKVIEFKTTNNNFKNDYNNTIRFSLTNSNSDKILNFWKQNLNINENNNNNEKFIPINNYKEKENINNELIKRESFGCLSSRTLNNYKINIKNIENGVIIDQINQLKMVFNLLERHNFKKQKPNTMVNCFNKWKSFSLNIKNQSLNKKIQTPRIDEKIINLKPFNTNRKIIDSMNVISPIDISLRKNFSLTKISPKIINVINVQNFNENNNYNYNFKYMPIKDIQIYSNKLRHSCAYSNNINNINLDLNNNNINENSINTNMNNNLNMTCFFMVNKNKRINPNIIYHKKKLSSTPINKNKFNFNYNIDNIINRPNFNNYRYKYDKFGNYDNSSLLMLEQNLSHLILQDLTNRTDNMKEFHTNMPMTPTNLRENSYNDLSSYIYPEQKFGFRKLSQIEEKEINFENFNKNKKKIYIKKQHYESKKERKDINQQNNIKSNILKYDENIYKNNFIKCLNIQFDKTCKDKFNKDKLDFNINNDQENNKCITITERYFNRNKINGKRGEIFLKKNNCKQLNDNNMINTEYKENTYRSNKNINKLNSIISSKNIIHEFKFRKKIKKDKINHSFERYPKNYEDFKLSKLLNNNSYISF